MLFYDRCHSFLLSDINIMLCMNFCIYAEFSPILFDIPLDFHYFCGLKM